MRQSAAISPMTWFLITPATASGPPYLSHRVVPTDPPPEPPVATAPPEPALAAEPPEPPVPRASDDSSLHPHTATFKPSPAKSTFAKFMSAPLLRLSRRDHSSVPRRCRGRPRQRA